MGVAGRVVQPGKPTVKKCHCAVPVERNLWTELLEWVGVPAAVGQHPGNGPSLAPLSAGAVSLLKGRDPVAEAIS